MTTTLTPTDIARRIEHTLLRPEAAPEPGFIPSRPSLRTRFEHWISGQQH